MKKVFVLSILLVLSTSALLAQNRTEAFEITLPEQRVPDSRYKTISYIDTRYDTTNMGLVQLGVFNAKARVRPKIPVAVQLTNVLNALVDSSAEDGELLFQLRQFSYAEVTSATSERGYCYIRAALYEKKDDQYYKLGAIDKVVYIKSVDVTRPLFRESSKLITRFIGDHLAQAAVEAKGYSYNDVLHLDQLEKKEIPLYEAEVYKDGL